MTGSTAIRRKSDAAMRVEVESYAGDQGIETVRRFRLDGRDVDVAENIDRWHGRGYQYHKVRGRDGNMYILRLDEDRSEWELTMFQSPEAEHGSTELPARKQRRPDGM